MITIREGFESDENTGEHDKSPKFLLAVVCAPLAPITGLLELIVIHSLGGCHRCGAPRVFAIHSP